MNRVAEDMLARELQVAILVVESDLSRTLEAVRAYRDEWIDEDLQAFVEAEVTEEDPIDTRLVTLAMEDSFGISRILG